MRIYVGNLSYNTGDADLRRAFEAFGTVTSAQVVMDRMTNRSRGFGFVEMANPAEGRAAVAALDGKDLQGRVVRVNEARPRNDRDDRGPR